MPNHLINENSPYLLQHAENPVDWRPWGPEALQIAQSEDKPIFLSIGYAACHWCHVMAHESFEDPATADILNQHFVSIKVDREERPDLDGIYMQAVVAITGQGGWPMSLFLTPDGKPFYGGAYFPLIRRGNMPAFREVLQTIARLWNEDRSSLLRSSVEITEYLQKKPLPDNASFALSDEKLNQAAMSLAQTYDWKYGGWGSAPKFPQPMTIEYLLRRASRGDNLAIEMAVHVLQAMSMGGMYDVVGGGFARYSTDDLWRTPHFEKMLYDNAQLALVYLHTWMMTGEEQFRQVCEQTLDFVLREMTHPAGGFYSSLDADSEGEEGKFYVWTPQEIRVALGDAEEADFLTAAYGVMQDGNFEGKNVLQRVLSDEQLAEKFDLPASAVPERMRRLHARLLATRSQRTPPGVDDKILAAWNALMLNTFAEAGRYLDREDYLAAAQHNARFLLENLYQEGRLLRSWRNGQAKQSAFLEDYASLILALLSIYQSDANPEWYAAALKLADEMVIHFMDSDGAFFDTRDDHEALIYRPKDLQDNATPSGNALAACALLQLAAYGDRSEWRSLVEEMLSGIQEAILRYPTAFAQWLCAADTALGPTFEIAVIGDLDHPDTQALLQILWKAYRPRQVVAISSYPAEPGAPALLSDRGLRNGLPTAYVCQGFTCLTPTNSPAELAAQLVQGLPDQR